MRPLFEQIEHLLEAIQDPHTYEPQLWALFLISFAPALVFGFLVLHSMYALKSKVTDVLSVVLLIADIVFFTSMSLLLLLGGFWAGLVTVILGQVLGFATATLLEKRIQASIEKSNARIMGKNELVAGVIDRVRREQPASVHICCDGVYFSDSPSQYCGQHLPETSDMLAKGPDSLIRFADHGYEDMDVTAGRAFANAVLAAVSGYKLLEFEHTHEETESKNYDGGSTATQVGDVVIVDVAPDVVVSEKVIVLDGITFSLIRKDLLPKPSEDPKLKSWR